MYVNNGAGQQGIEFWGLSPSDNNAQINNFKLQYGVGHPCAGTEGGGPAAIDIAIAGQPFYGYPTWIVVCPDRSFYFDVCWPPTISCFDPYFESCAPALLAGFSASDYEVCANSEIQFTDESIGAVTSWDWTFEGGEPSASTDQHPVVNYPEAGQWDVSLSVSDGTNSHTFDSPGLIQVNELPDVTLMSLDTVCVNYEPFELTGGLPEGGSYAGNGVEEGYFYPDMAGVGTHEIIYSYADDNGCVNWAAEMIEVEICTGIDDPEQNEIFIVPNPASNQVMIFVGGNNLRVNFSIIDVEGRQVMNSFFTGNKTNLDLSAFKRGLYMVRFETEGKLFIRKLVVI